MMNLLCRLFGHKWTVKGVTGRYEWCARCGERRGGPSRLALYMSVRHPELGPMPTHTAYQQMGRWYGAPVAECGIGHASAAENHKRLEARLAELRLI